MKIFINHDRLTYESRIKVHSELHDRTMKDVIRFNCLSVDKNLNRRLRRHFKRLLKNAQDRVEYHLDMIESYERLLNHIL